LQSEVTCCLGNHLVGVRGRLRLRLRVRLSVMVRVMVRVRVRLMLRVTSTNHYLLLLAPPAPTAI